MIGIDKIETYYPPKELSIFDLQERLNISDFQIKLLNRFHGLEKIRFDSSESLINLLSFPLEKLLKKIDKSKVKYLIYAHTIQVVTPYPLNIVEELKKKFKLEHVTSFSIIQHNCASSITSLEMINYLLKNEDEKAILITGEKTFTKFASIIPNISIMGEASTASLISKGNFNDKLLSIESKVIGKFYEGIDIEGELLKEFERIYVPTIVDTIDKAIKKANIKVDQIKLILPHNVNKSSWYKVAERIQIDREKIYLSNISKLGHCFCSDPFLNYIDAKREGLLEKGDYYLLVSVGLGATFSVAVLQH